ncbi:uncharacterized protein LOC129750417 [Uranotaenia lowii]|uniref:uncharacterized protein LOC129750417 n=1 Tax=Uranotaenia lowii TaxID=190385 RepID=UPI0024788442|nr:uncharacterized protein LOC129750417 [Uranotaenia lowii]
MISKFVLSFSTFVVLTNAEECFDINYHAKEYSKCCSVPSALPEEPLHKCIKVADEKVPDREMESFMACIDECYLTEIGVMVNQSINLNKIKEYIRPMEPTAGEISMKVWEVCVELKHHLLELQKGHQLKCDPFATGLKACVRITTIRHCPKNYFYDQSKWFLSPIGSRFVRKF